MDTFQLYRDMEARTNGEIYIGVVGPVRTGKSTFIKRFMDVMVLPHMDNESQKERARDELPQSASGRTIMTTEPKFVPQEAAEIHLEKDLTAKIRLIDCVGYMVEGAKGHIEGTEERMVKTPWMEQAIPFSKAAEIGTEKVIREHSTIGIVVTTDGSIGEIERDSYRKAEAQTINELKSIHKPFVVLVNSQKPYGEDAKNTVNEVEASFGVKAIPVNCAQLKKTDIYQILQEIIYEFPVSEMEFYIPKWVEMLSDQHVIKQELFACIRECMGRIDEIRDVVDGFEAPDTTYINQIQIRNIAMDTGNIQVDISVPEKYYYEIMGTITDEKIEGQYDLIRVIKQLADDRKDYEEIKDAFTSVRIRGYGMVSPGKNDITLDEPTLIRQGNKFGVKIHSQAPSIHLIRANIETEIAPIVGNEQQAKELIDYLSQMSRTEEGMWATNIFGKSMEELVIDGMKNKMLQITEESQEKLQNTMQKIVNDSNGGMICIII